VAGLTTKCHVGNPMVREVQRGVQARLLDSASIFLVAMAALE